MKVCLDAGHYGKYNRSKVVRDYYESEMNWKLQGYLTEELTRYGVVVTWARDDQKKDLALTSRGKKAKGCDLFISLHSNACDAEYVDYPLVITMNDGKCDVLGNKLAANVQKLMATTQKGKIIHKTNSDKTEYYGVLRGAASVGVMGMIIEHSFHSNTKAATWLLNDDNLKLMAKSEADIIAEHFGLTKQQTNEKIEESAPSAPKAPESSKQPEIGDVVAFTGTKQYKSSTAIISVSCKPGAAKITAMAPGKKHPYHLVRTGSVGPYGWVDEADIAEFANGGKVESTEPWEPAKNEIVNFTGTVQYSSADGNTAKAAKAGQATITAIAKGKKHPYHLVRTGKTGPWGWVDANTFKKV